eukprot:gene2988-5779_t
MDNPSTLDEVSVLNARELQGWLQKEGLDEQAGLLQSISGHLLTLKAARNPEWLIQECGFSKALAETLLLALGLNPDVLSCSTLVHTPTIAPLYSDWNPLLYSPFLHPESYTESQPPQQSQQYSIGCFSQAYHLPFTHQDASANCNWPVHMTYGSPYGISSTAYLECISYDSNHTPHTVPPCFPVVSSHFKSQPNIPSHFQMTGLSSPNPSFMCPTQSKNLQRSSAANEIFTQPYQPNLIATSAQNLRQPMHQQPPCSSCPSLQPTNSIPEAPRKAIPPEMTPQIVSFTFTAENGDLVHTKLQSKLFQLLNHRLEPATDQDTIWVSASLDGSTCYISPGGGRYIDVLATKTGSKILNVHMVPPEIFSAKQWPQLSAVDMKRLKQTLPITSADKGKLRSIFDLAQENNSLSFAKLRYQREQSGFRVAVYMRLPEGSTTWRISRRRLTIVYQQTPLYIPRAPSVSEALLSPNSSPKHLPQLALPLQHSAHEHEPYDNETDIILSSNNTEKRKHTAFNACLSDEEPIINSMNYQRLKTKTRVDEADDLAQMPRVGDFTNVALEYVTLALTSTMSPLCSQSDAANDSVSIFHTYVEQCTHLVRINRSRVVPCFDTPLTLLVGSCVRYQKQTAARVSMRSGGDVLITLPQELPHPVSVLLIDSQKVKGAVLPNSPPHILDSASRIIPKVVGPNYQVLIHRLAWSTDNHFPFDSRHSGLGPYYLALRFKKEQVLKFQFPGEWLQEHCTRKPLHRDQQDQFNRANDDEIACGTHSQATISSWSLHTPSDIAANPSEHTSCSSSGSSPRNSPQLRTAEVVAAPVRTTNCPSELTEALYTDVLLPQSALYLECKLSNKGKRHSKDVHINLIHMQSSHNQQQSKLQHALMTKPENLAFTKQDANDLITQGCDGLPSAKQSRDLYSNCDL